MTRATAQIRTEPDGTPAAGVQTRVRTLSGIQLGSALTSDSNGIVTFEQNGSPGPIILSIEGQPGGDRSLASGEAMTSGVFSPAELPAALTALGDGVVRGYRDEMAVSVSGLTLTIGAGAALVSGYPVVCYSPTTIDLDRPTTSTRVDRVLVAIIPAIGIANATVLLGDEGEEDPPLVLPDGYAAIALATVTVPRTEALTVVDARAYTHERPDISAVARVAAVSTPSLSGAALDDLAVTLDLPRTVTYDLSVEMTGQQVAVTPGGHGLIAIEIDGGVGTYTGIGQRDGAVATSEVSLAVGPEPILIRGFAKATLGTISLSGMTLSARAVPRG